MIVAGLVQLGLYAFAFRKLGGLSDNKDGIADRLQVPLYATNAFSVIICARNECTHLRSFLPRVLRQNYFFEQGNAAFEVIVVNDGSNDDTAAYLTELTVQFGHLRIVTISLKEQRNYPGKKFPLSKGLAAACHEWIACIDADCSPATDVWLHCMAAPLLCAKELAIGYGGYVLQRGAVNVFTRYETLHAFMQYYSFTKAGAPYMAVGRNLAATKAVFLKAQQHVLWSEMPSGDDDLLVRICATHENVGLVTHPASFTWTQSKTTWHEYLQQKRRHVSTGKLYKPLPKLLLAAHSLSIALACTAPIATAIFLPAPYWAKLLVLASVVPALLLPCQIFSEASGFLKERTSWPKWMIFFFCWSLYNAVLAPYILWKTKQRWK